MPNWYWEKKDLRNTPSQAKGMDFDTETRYRREGVRFILEIGRTMSLYHLTLATGAVYFHRFYMFHAFQDFPRYVVATCCLFLAGKAEETPKKCRDIVRTVRTLTNDKQFSTFGLDPREEIMVLERVLLQTIKFDLQVDHPYQSIIKVSKLTTENLLSPMSKSLISIVPSITVLKKGKLNITYLFLVR